jgi:DivIVA domain-containing protein
VRQRRSWVRPGRAAGASALAGPGGTGDSTADPPDGDAASRAVPAGIGASVGRRPAESAPGSEAGGARLAAWVEAGNFSATRLRPGYDMQEADAFASAIRDTFAGIREPSLTPDEIRTRQFAATRLRPGYDEAEVDAFLDEAELRLAAVRGTKDTIGQCGRVLAGRERAEGAGHPDTIAARASLACAYRTAGRLRQAIPQYERTPADRERVQGRDHRDTLVARSNLAACYQQARRVTDAISQYERALAGSERIPGAGDPETLTTRCDLATAYCAMGRLPEAVAVFQRTLDDCERYLGPGHQMTQAVRENLDAATPS